MNLNNNNNKNGMWTWLRALVLFAVMLPTALMAQDITGLLFFTEIPLDNLSAVSEDAKLTIKGNSQIGTMVDDGEGHQVLKAGTGHVFGGGDQSSVTATPPSSCKATPRCSATYTVAATSPL